MTKRFLGTTAGALAAAGLCLVAAACSPSSSHTPAKPSPTTAVAAPTLQPFPTLPENEVLVEDPHQTGQHSTVTRALTTRHIAVQMACVGTKSGFAGAVIHQGGKAIYTINKQPCNGLVQKITLTPDASTPLTVTAQADPGNQYALLVIEQ